MRRKLDALLDEHPIRIVHPIAAEKWIRKIDDDGTVVSRRRSPKRGIAADVCSELTSFPSLLSHPNFSLEVLLVQEEEVRRPDPGAWRKKGWRVAERRLVGILERGRPPDAVAVEAARSLHDRRYRRGAGPHPPRRSGRGLLPAGGRGAGGGGPLEGRLRVSTAVRSIRSVSRGGRGRPGST